MVGDIIQKYGLRCSESWGSFHGALLVRSIRLTRAERIRAYQHFWSQEYTRPISGELAEKLLHHLPGGRIDISARFIADVAADLTSLEQSTLWYAWQEATPDWCSRSIGHLATLFDIHSALREYRAREDAVTILDVGCGNGVAVEGLNAMHNVQAFGIDLAPHGPRTVLGSLAQPLPFRDASFDIVYAVCSLMYLQDARPAIAEMVRVARPGGHIFVDDYNPSFVNATLASHGCIDVRRQASTVHVRRP